MAQVVHEVRNAPHQPCDGHRDDHGPAQRDERGDRHYGKGEVQCAEVPHEVLVVGTVDAYPLPTEAGIVLIERPGRERRPDSELDANRGPHHEHHAHNPFTHGSPPFPGRPPATLLARWGSEATSRLRHGASCCSPATTGSPRRRLTRSST